MVSGKLTEKIEVKRVIADRSDQFQRVLDDFVCKHDPYPEFRSPFIYKDRVYSVMRHRVISGDPANLRTSGTVEITASFASSLETLLQEPPEAFWEPIEIPDPSQLIITGADLFPDPDGTLSATCPYCFDRRIGIGDELPNSEEWVSMLPDYDPDTNTIRDAACEHCKGQDWKGPCIIAWHGMFFDYSAIAPFRLFFKPMMTPKKAANAMLFRAPGQWGMRGMVASLNVPSQSCEKNLLQTDAE